MNRFLYKLSATCGWIFCLAAMNIPSAYGQTQCLPLGGHFDMRLDSSDSTCKICHDFVNGSYTGENGKNLRWIRSQIEFPPGVFHNNVVYNNNTGQCGGSLADGDDSKLDGPCEVCHTATKYHKNSGDGTKHNDCMKCTSCHQHFKTNQTNYFSPPPMIGPQAHNTHLSDPKGPNIMSQPQQCFYCHQATGDMSRFQDGQPLDTTTICNNCHSVDGPYDGVGARSPSTDPDYPNWLAYGAKINQTKGVYVPSGAILKGANKQWCFGCHDNTPSVVLGATAPNILGDDVTYGFNRSAHAGYNDGYRAGILCETCHDPSLPHKDRPAGRDELYIPANGYPSGQTESFCLGCHKDASVAPTTNATITNYSYSRKASGDTNLACPDTILEAFSFVKSNGAKSTQCGSNSGSSHNLSDIQLFIGGKWGFEAAPNPCVACHNPHFATNDEHKAGSRGYPVARPSTRANGWMPFGDDKNERMSSHTKYQAPYDATGVTFEPDGSATSDGSNLTDYATFCKDCHNASNTIYSKNLARNLRKFDWDLEQHGGAAAQQVKALRAPYQDMHLGTYFLSCTDCHESHGSPNIMLIREKINNGNVSIRDYAGGGNGPEGVANTEWLNVCSKCHDIKKEDANGGKHTHPTSLAGTLNCGDGLCHNTSKTTGELIFKPCTNCHNHGQNTITGAPGYNGPLF